MNFFIPAKKLSPPCIILIQFIFHTTLERNCPPSQKIAGIAGINSIRVVLFVIT
ncbi:Uncharacterised protein [Salmonella enterica subsp. enterica serovar Bovismorbificans]|uniref:Uncharacterized protein n=1 Tax=Salmonella enterica subsp. enterica serovar Bovismorbificans TaxID=58097 RepID=A0A655D054_SALET|nr:Uncharacterised protein [Salmonella enterica subsp. enterica serovar Bovismorbificans]